LAALRDLLRDLSGVPELTQRRPGIFYRGGRAFLHFHEDPAGIFADVRTGDDFDRLRVTTAREQRVLVRRVRRLVGAGSATTVSGRAESPARRTGARARATRS
jgi:hypothetical protein